MNSTSNFSERYKDHVRRKTIERVLMTPKQKKEKELRDRKEFEWESSVRSSDPEVLRKLFQKEWPLFEVCVDNKKDVKKLKKMFEIK